jgi:hypothetical protein
MIRTTSSSVPGTVTEDQLRKGHTYIWSTMNNQWEIERESDTIDNDDKYDFGASTLLFIPPTPAL